MRLRSGKRLRAAQYPKRRNMRRSFRGSSAPYTSGLGVTNQHDERHVYRKRRMPRRKRRQWGKFVNKVHAVSEKDLGSRTVVLNKTVNFDNTVAANQNLIYCALYPGTSTDSWMNDINQLSALENIAANPTSAAGNTVQLSTKWIFKSAVLDVTFRNAANFNTDGATLVPDSRGKMEVDVYELISNKAWQDTAITAANITALFSQADTDTQNLLGAGTAVNIALRGVTPWDVPLALSQYGLKILKKTKYFVQNQDTFTYQLRDPKRRVITESRMARMQGCNVPRWTRHILIISKLVPGLTIGGAAGNWTDSVRLGITRKYFYKIEGQNEDRDRYIVV